MTSKKWRRILVIVLFLIALVFLIWGYFPFHRVTEILNLPPGKMQIPAPTGWESGILALL
ncbi:MAG: hypothetical protein U9O54_07165 [Chloroflexota bacterium]|nr:hypothetical protein [Chloroflexota bacterium]